MELELKKADLDAYETGGELILTQEETTETIVPDYCPDIARIIETDGKVYLHNREVRDGKAEITGTVRVTVLYTPEVEGGIRTLEFAIPFRAESDNRALLGCQYILADTEIEFLETRMLNPRKVFTRCKLISRVTGYRKAALAFCADLQGEEMFGIEKRQETQQATALMQISEKAFTFTDELSLSPGKDGAAEVLNTQVSWSVSETKIVGNKLIFKGMFSFCVLYRTKEGACRTTTGELPFSQIMEVDGVSESSNAAVILCITGTDIQIGDDPEGRSLAVTLYLHATALLRENKELSLLTDMYSTAYEMSYEAQPLTLTEYCETLERRQMVREVLEIGVVAETLLSVAVHCGAVSASREGDVAVLRTVACVRALYLDEGGSPLLAERNVDVICQLEVPENCRLRVRAVCGEEPQGSLGDRGIEVRFPVDFRVEAEKQVKKVSIVSARLDTDTPKDSAGAPSMVLRCLGRQETAWDLAKRYNTTIDAILAANQLESEILPQDRLLLIPRKR